MSKKIMKNLITKVLYPLAICLVILAFLFFMFLVNASEVDVVLLGMLMFLFANGICIYYYVFYSKRKIIWCVLSIVSLTSWVILLLQNKLSIIDFQYNQNLILPFLIALWVMICLPVLLNIVNYIKALKEI